jgi:spore coat protein A
MRIREMAGGSSIVSSSPLARKEQFVHLTDGKGNVLPGVKIDKKRELTFYDYVDPAKDGPDPNTIKEYANSTTWNGLESPSIAYDFPDDGVSERPRMGSIELWEIAFCPRCRWQHTLSTSIWRNSRFSVASR